MNTKKIEACINSLKETTRLLEGVLESYNLSVDAQIFSLSPGDFEHDKLKEISTLRLMLNSDTWPNAVPEESICKTEEEKLIRAESIIDTFHNIENKKILDFGCGEGHLAYQLSKLNIKSVLGYDILDQEWDHFSKSENLTFSTDIKKVNKNGPYDIIVLYDVIDHVELNDDEENVLEIAKKVLAPSGKIYLRCHPWVSRHGSHLYKQINKAYVHLVFNKDELYSLGIRDELYLNKFIHPLGKYRKLIKEAGLVIYKEEITTAPVERFFKKEANISRRIKQNWSSSEDFKLAKGHVFPERIMETQFIDFVLI